MTSSRWLMDLPESDRLSRAASVGPVQICDRHILRVFQARLIGLRLEGVSKP